MDLIAPRLPSYPAYLGIQFPAIRETHIMTITYIAEGGWIKFDRLLENAKSEDYEVVIIPVVLGILTRYALKQRRSASFKKWRLRTRSSQLSVTVRGLFLTRIHSRKACHRLVDYPPGSRKCWRYVYRRASGHRWKDCHGTSANRSRCFRRSNR